MFSEQVINWLSASTICVSAAERHKASHILSVYKLEVNK